jgi:hypothetical protein
MASTKIEQISNFFHDTLIYYLLIAIVFKKVIILNLFSNLNTN